MKLTIDRSKWWRGNGSRDSALSNKAKKMCCLGFLSLACGYSEEDIRGLKTIEHLVENLANDSCNPEDWERVCKRLPEKIRPDLVKDTMPNIDVPMEERLAGNVDDVIIEITSEDVDLVQKLYSLNDDPIGWEHFDMDEFNVLSSEEKEEYKGKLREKLLTETFAEAGVEVEFIG